jgi:cob(I)alamin adenosyltransferase
LIQVYTGNGKGKTTAALGLALRAAGAGLKVYIAQFIKGRPYSELKALKKFRNIKVEQCGRSCFIRRKPVQTDIACAKNGFAKIKKIAYRYNVIILDEVNIALHLRLLELKEVVCFLKALPKKTEIILTGRFAPPEIMKLADLVSEIKEVKHYFKRSIPARRGIEF